MAENISLTSSMRSNLRALQQTAELLDKTQKILSTGKKVNTASDDPIAYFTAKSLNFRADTIKSLQDSMKQSIETLNAANNGIVSLSDLITQAKSIAIDAKTADNTQDKVKLSLASVVDDDTVEMGDTTFVVSSEATSAGEAFAKGSTDRETAINLADVINNFDWSEQDYTFKAAVSGVNVTIEKIDNSTDMQVNAVEADITASATFTKTLVEADESQLESLQKDYDSLRSQITQLAKDSAYKGTNLLNNENMSVKFENNSLEVAGFDATATGLKITEANDWTTDVANIDGDIELLDSAITTLNRESAKMATNINTISVRQNFSTAMINTLTDGANALVLADMNEEGAKLLMLQTQQSLASTTLALASQNAQSVLRLFS